jgi:N-acetylmuramoyl-L-alanine amidase
MHAVISEVAFITNTDDRTRLLNDEFIQNAAVALSDAVLKALDQIK